MFECKTKKYCYSNISDCWCVKSDELKCSKYVEECTIAQLESLLEGTNTIEHRVFRNMCFGFQEIVIIHCFRCKIGRVFINGDYRSLEDMRGFRF